MAGSATRSLAEDITPSTTDQMPNADNTPRQLTADEIEFANRFLNTAAAVGLPPAQAEQMLEIQLQTEGGLEALIPILQSWETQLQGSRKPIGVSEGYIAQRFENVPPPTTPTGRAFQSDIGGRPIGRGEPTGQRVTDVEPQYFEGDQYLLAGRPPEEIIRIQNQLKRAGLLTTFIPGLWDDNTAEAYKDVLAAANRRGSTAGDALEFMMSNPVETTEKSSQLVKPSFIQPDYATLAQGVKSYMRSRLGREPSKEELAELTGTMSSLYRAEFDANRTTFDQEQYASGVGPPKLTLDEPLTDVDSSARFAEYFESRFGPEIDRLAALPEVRNNMTNVFSSLSTMSSLIGGNG